MEMGFRKKRKKRESSPLLGRIRPRPRPPPLSRAPVLPPFGPIAGPLPRALPLARPPRSLSLTSQPHLPATLSVLPLAGRPAPPVSRVVVFLAYDAPSSPCPSPCCTGEFGTAPSLPLDRVLAQSRPAVKSHRRRCATLMPALCTSPAPVELRRSPPLGRL
jgi:hypothetical protein